MRAVLMAAILLLASGCVSEPTPEQWQAKALSFVQDGQSTREQILLKLGAPTAQFEDGRIMTYRIARNGPGDLVVVQRERIQELGTQSYSGVEYSLVLVFDGSTLRQHSLVAAR